MWPRAGAVRGTKQPIDRGEGGLGIRSWSLIARCYRRPVSQRPAAAGLPDLAAVG